MKTELVTVIVPVYKVENYLDICVKSIVNQTYRNLEILLIDDGSPDRCPTLCENWAKQDNRIRVIHKKNQGLGMARNTGIEYATGEFICYIDSDDYVDVDIISRAYHTMMQSNADLVLFGFHDLFPDGSKSRFSMDLQKTVFTGPEITNDLLPWLIHTHRRKEPVCQFAFTAWSGFLRRSILEENQIRFLSEREIISEDTLYLLELYSHLQTVALIPEPLYCYRVNPASLTKTYQKDRQKKNNAFLVQARKTVEKQGYGAEVMIRVTMLYQDFSLEAMKHVMRMKTSYRDKRSLLAEFISDPELNQSITRENLSRNSVYMALFLICLKCNLQFFCYVLLWMREKKMIYCGENL